MTKKLVLYIIMLSSSFVHGSCDLVNMAKAYPDILLNIRYATKNNCVQEPIYSSAYCYLHKDVARALHHAQEELMAHHSLKLVVFDGYQPKSARCTLWELLPHDHYLTDPVCEDDHARGCAVDVSLITMDGKALDMGTDFDCLTIKAQRSYIALSSEVLTRRALLDEIMKRHGFVASQEECWWHYVYQNRENYPVLSCEFEELD